MMAVRRWPVLRVMAAVSTRTSSAGSLVISPLGPDAGEQAQLEIRHERLVRVGSLLICLRRV
jgi:hypothetical protein